MWRPRSHFPHDPNHIEQDYDKMVEMPPDMSPAANWFSEGDALRVKAALVTFAKKIAPPGDVSRLGLSNIGILKQLGKLESHGHIVAQAEAIRMWKEPEVKAEEWILKGDLRRAVPCAKIEMIKELWLQYDHRDFNDGSAVTQGLSKFDQLTVESGRGVARSLTRPEWAGTQVTIKAGGALSSEGVVATVTKPSKDAKFGVGLEAPKGGGGAPPGGGGAPKNFVMAEPAKAGTMPKISNLGSVLEGSGLQAGDEILWVNKVECTGSVKQCTEALGKAEAGEVTIVARRPRSVISAVAVTQLPIGASVAVAVASEVMR